MILAGSALQYYLKFWGICFPRGRCVKRMVRKMNETQENRLTSSACLMRHGHGKTGFLKRIWKYAAWICKP